MPKISYAKYISGRTRYLVVCQNDRQVGLFFDKLVLYWKSICGKRSCLYVDNKEKMVGDPLDSVVVISERKLFEFMRGRAPIKFHVVNVVTADRCLDFRMKKEEG